jgi:hypothetical protein
MLDPAELLRITEFDTHDSNELTLALGYCSTRAAPVYENELAWRATKLRYPLNEASTYHVNGKLIARFINLSTESLTTIST